MSTEIESAGVAISLKKLTKTYGSVMAVDGIDLEVEPGEFLVLLGPSGSGKTTTLNMIAGFVDVTSGELLIGGESAHRLPPYKRDIGMVFQHYALFPHMSVQENLAYPLRQRKIPKVSRSALVARAMDTVGLKSLGQRMPSELSGGQQQRVALARAMVYKPGVLLMDEPLGALDKKLRDTLQLEIKRIHDSLRTTFVYVTHDQDEALVLADRIAVFNDGKIEQLGQPMSLYEHPKTLFVGQFLGESSLFAGTATKSIQGTRMQIEGVKFHALKGEPLDNCEATILVRPERMRLTDPDEKLSDPVNTLQGRVTEEIYLGNVRRLLVQHVLGRTALVRETADRLSGYHVGDRVTLSFNAEDAIAVRSPPSK